jgi:protein-S-isoprenylcysteine O-methyltransferase Ste14
MAIVNRILMGLYGLTCYLIGTGSLVLLILFANNHIAALGYNWLNSLAIDTLNSTPAENPLLINIGLLLLFGIQHSVMARPWFKTIITHIIPERIERSTYVLATGIVIIALVQFWQPMTASIWHIENTTLRTGLNILYYGGWVISLLATHMINHYHLMGLQQSMTQREEATVKEFVTPMLYKFVRHPIQTGVLIALYATPDMTIGRAVFALGVTVYILVGLYFEERDLIREFGQTYKDYKARVGGLLPVKFNR